LWKSAKSRTEKQFTATQKRDKQILKEREKARREKAEHVAKLRALRLAKEAADKEASEEPDVKSGAAENETP
jgi:colicin import membrane protein|tara:strand:- start:2742 stop:2957 length:216 start_codon:yes stop_codon:yes gene_type:complete